LFLEINYTLLTNLYRNRIVDYCDGIILRPLGLGARNACLAGANDPPFPRQPQKRFKYFRGLLFFCGVAETAMRSFSVEFSVYVAVAGFVTATSSCSSFSPFVIFQSFPPLADPLTNSSSFGRPLGYLKWPGCSLRNNTLNNNCPEGDMLI